MTEKILAIGLMSGTSLDGVDVALTETDGEGFVRLKASLGLPFHENFRARLSRAAKSDIPLDDVMRLERAFTEENHRAVAALLEREGLVAGDVAVLGFHGQTIRHLPHEGLTWQMGDASYLAEKTGIAVVADFRRRDMAAGGQGAPLVPLFHQVLLADKPKPVAVLNIGGVANLTWLGDDGTVRAGDTGPGVGLLNTWMQEAASLSHDPEGIHSLAGTVDEAFVETALSEAYFGRDFPKSADRYVDFAGIHLPANASTENGAATLCALTAEAAARSLKKLPALPQILWVSGGGRKNPRIMAELTARTGVAAHPIEKAGLCGDMLEAQCFAWLAVRRLKNLPLTLPETTGCAHPTCGGIVATSRPHTQQEG